jgi:hypothetical protein
VQRGRAAGADLVQPGAMDEEARRHLFGRR